MQIPLSSVNRPCVSTTLVKKGLNHKCAYSKMYMDPSFKFEPAKLKAKRRELKFEVKRKAEGRVWMIHKVFSFSLGLNAGTRQND